MQFFFSSKIKLNLKKIYILMENKTKILIYLSFAVFLLPLKICMNTKLSASWGYLCYSQIVSVFLWCRAPKDPPLRTLPQTLSLSVLLLTRVHQQFETLLVSRRYTRYSKQQWQQLERAKQE